MDVSNDSAEKWKFTYDLVAGSPFGKALEMIDGYHPEPWWLLVLMGISTFAIMLVVVSSVCVKEKK